MQSPSQIISPRRMHIPQLADESQCSDLVMQVDYNLCWGDYDGMYVEAMRYRYGLAQNDIKKSAHDQPTDDDFMWICQWAQIGGNKSASPMDVFVQQIIEREHTDEVLEMFLADDPEFSEAREYGWAMADADRVDYRAAVL